MRVRRLLSRAVGSAALASGLGTLNAARFVPELVNQLKH
jgi:hypothetical protein